MLLREFKPCVHLEEIRCDFSKFDDCLSKKLGCSDLYINLSGEEEYNKIISEKSTSQYEIIKKETHFIILVELLAGAFSISLQKKEAIVQRIYNGSVTEANAYELIEMLIKERNDFFGIYVRKSMNNN